MSAVRVTQLLTLVLRDDDSLTPAAAPYPQTINIAQWEDAEIPFECVDADGAVADVSGGAFILTVRRNYFDCDPPLISREATPVAYAFGTGFFPIGSFDTGIDIATYRVDIWYIDSAGKRWQVLPASDFNILEDEGRPLAPVTVPSSQQPLAQGLPGYLLQETIFEGAALAGDTIVFDTALTEPGGAPGYRTLKSLGFIPGVTVVAGWVTVATLNESVADIRTYGKLSPSVTGLTGADFGLLTVDHSTGRIRSLVPGEVQYGYCDGNGNAHMTGGVIE